VVVVVATGGAFIRIGNFMNSEILGKPSDLPWAVIFANARQLTEAQQMIPRHPTMLYEALLCLVIFTILWCIYKKYSTRPPEGSLFGPLLVLLFGGRLLLEYTTLNPAAFTGGWACNMGQWLSIPLIALGLWRIFKQVSWKQNSPAAVQH